LTLLEVLSKKFPDSSRTTLRQMLQHGRVRVNGEPEKDAKRDIDDDDVVDIAQKSVQYALPAGLALLHEDDDVLVVLKSNGLLTVATERERETTAQAYLNVYLKEKGEERVHVVHRLDRETSGVLVFAKNFKAREALKEQFAAHTTERMYVGIIEGQLDPDVFVRVHRSAIVQLGRVREIQSSPGGRYQAVLKSGIRIPLGSSGIERLGLLTPRLEQVKQA